MQAFCKISNLNFYQLWGDVLVGIVYFMVIIIANTVGAVSGMGGGVIIKPLLDLVGVHSVAGVSFYSTVAVFTMSIVSTTRQLKNKVSFNVTMAALLSLGAVVGGTVGNYAFNYLLLAFQSDAVVQLIQILLTIATVLFAFLYSRYSWRSFNLNFQVWYVLCGLILGFLASLLGIGGGPINVALLMLMFSVPIKEATVYSICTILFSQLAKLATIAIVTGFDSYDLAMLWYVIPAAIIGGILGANLSKIMTKEKILEVFQGVIITVLLINIYNGVQLFI